jgi:hypothetical protein
LFGILVAGLLISSFNDVIIERNREVLSIQSEKLMKQFYSISMFRNFSQISTISTDCQISVKSDCTNDSINSSELNVKESKFNKIKSIYLESYRDELSKLKTDSIFNILIIITLIFVGSIFMSVQQNLNPDVAIYWSVTTLCTIGYGDVVPTKPETKCFAIVFILIGCTFMAKTFSNIVQYPMILRKFKNEIKVLNQFGRNLSRERIRGLMEECQYLDNFAGLRRNPHEITKSEFCILVFQLMNKIEGKHLGKILFY